MAAPNLYSLPTGSIVASLFQLTPADTSVHQIVSNAAASGLMIRVTGLYAANTSGSAVTVTVNVYSAAALGGTAFSIASAVSIPANSTLVVIDKTAPIELVENTSLGFSSGTSSNLTVNCNYETWQ